MVVAAGEIIFASEQTIARGVGVCTTNTPLTATHIDIPGCSVTLTAQTSSAFYIAWATCDLGKVATASTQFGLGWLSVDGVEETECAVGQNNDAVVWRATCTQSWTGALTAGSHTFKLRGSASGSGIWTMNQPHSKLIVAVFG